MPIYDIFTKINSSRKKNSQNWAWSNFRSKWLALKWIPLNLLFYCSDIKPACCRKLFTKHLLCVTRRTSISTSQKGAPWRGKGLSDSRAPGPGEVPDPQGTLSVECHNLYRLPYLPLVLNRQLILCKDKALPFVLITIIHTPATHMPQVTRTMKMSVRKHPKIYRCTIQKSSHGVEGLNDKNPKTYQKRFLAPSIKYYY